DESRAEAEIPRVELLGDVLVVAAEAEAAVEDQRAAIREPIAEVEADGVLHVVPPVDVRLASTLQVARLEGLDRVGVLRPHGEGAASGPHVEAEEEVVAVADGQHAQLEVGGAVRTNEALIQFDGDVALGVQQAVEAEVGVQLALPAGPARLRAGVTDVVQASVGGEAKGARGHLQLDPRLEVEDDVAHLFRLGTALLPARKGIIAALELQRGMESSGAKTDTI